MFFPTLKERFFFFRNPTSRVPFTIGGRRAWAEKTLFFSWKPGFFHFVRTNHGVCNQTENFQGLNSQGSFCIWIVIGMFRKCRNIYAVCGSPASGPTFWFSWLCQLFNTANHISTNLCVTCTCKGFHVLFSWPSIRSGHPLFENDGRTAPYANLLQRSNTEDRIIPTDMGSCSTSFSSAISSQLMVVF